MDHLEVTLSSKDNTAVLNLVVLVSKAEFTQRVLAAGQVSIRMKFAKAISRRPIKRPINSLLICLFLAKLCMK